MGVSKVFECPLRMATRIEICGGIASGKTTFAGLFEKRANIIYENFQAVPFWQDFYAAPREYAFETELSFLLQHYHQVKKALSQSPGVIVCDFSFLLDAAYAQVSLNPANRHAFTPVLQQIKEELGPPQLLVALNCSSEIEMNRIEVRGRTEESQIGLGFLTQLNSAIEYELQSVRESIIVVDVNSIKEDFANDQVVREKWLQVVASGISDIHSRETTAVGSSVE